MKIKLILKIMITVINGLVPYFVSEEDTEWEYGQFRDVVGPYTHKNNTHKNKYT